MRTKHQHFFGWFFFATGAGGAPGTTSTGGAVISGVGVTGVGVITLGNGMTGTGVGITVTGRGGTASIGLGVCARAALAPQRMATVASITS